MFYSSIQLWDPGAKPQQGPAGRSPPEAGAFLKVHSLKFKARWKWKA